jgi:hypothetical protein
MTDSQWQERLDALLAKYDRGQNVELFEELVKESEIITSWDEFEEWVAPFKDNGCFRGHADASWSLITTLERKVWKRWVVDIPLTQQAPIACGGGLTLIIAS